MYIVTGGAGFIGSCIVRSLNNRGIADIVIVDNIASTDKWMNLRNKRFVKYVHKNDFLSELSQYKNLDAIIHMGASSSTTERNFDYLWKNNFEYTKTLWNFCAQNGVRFIYASSAATYGDGALGFSDRMNIDYLRPLNGYGYSKQLFDQWVNYQSIITPTQHVGLKFFNVYGPNEYFKGNMASMIYHGYRQIVEDGEIRLFKSCDPDFVDGGQLRDFIYVKDICSVIMWLLDHKNVNGLFNLGTGKAQSFKDLAEATFHALGLAPNIKYIDMPENLKGKYQYYTQADITSLKEAGYDKPFRDLEEGAKDYVQNHLSRSFEIY